VCESQPQPVVLARLPAGDSRGRRVRSATDSVGGVGEGTLADMK